MKSAASGSDQPAEPGAAPANGNGREMELKFLVDEAGFRLAQQSPLLGGPKRAAAKRLRAVYYDTEGRDLAGNRMVLRVRTERGRHTMTMKAAAEQAANPFSRREIEVPVPAPAPDLALFGTEVAADLVRVTHGAELRPVFVTDIRRVVHRVASRESRIDVAFDTGTIGGGAAREPVREIELELVDGDPSDLFDLALALLDTVPARLGVLSKAERGALLSAGAVPSAVRAISPLAPDHSVDAAIAEVIGTCIQHFVANWPAFEAGAVPEPVHQMRVAMRRLRAALALFERRFHCAEFGNFRAEAKSIATAMGEARNWDVFAEMLRDGPLAAFGQDDGFAALQQASEAHRRTGYAAVAQMLRAPATSRFVVSVMAFVARRGWRNGVEVPDLPRLTAPAAGLAAQQLERLRRRVRKRGRHLLDLPADERHEVRIALKNLRYATDFFGALFADHSAVKSYARGAAKLQDVLGSFNDMVMVTDLVRRLDLGDDAAAARAAGIMIGWYGRAGQADAGAMRKAWRGFRRAKPFWTAALDMMPGPA